MCQLPFLFPDVSFLETRGSKRKKSGDQWSTSGKVPSFLPLATDTSNKVSRRSTSVG